MEKSGQNAMSLFILFRNPNLCQLFLDGHFSVQINHIAGTGKSVNHAGDQENKKQDSKWFNSYLWRESSWNNFFTLSRVVSEIEKELREISHSLKKETKILHSLNQNKINIPSKNIISLSKTCDNAKFQFTD